MAKRTSTPSTKPEPEPATAEVRELPLVALRETVIFPEMIVPLQVGREKSVAALNAAVESNGPIALVTQRQAEQEDIRRILWIRHLTRDRGVNLAGVRTLFELEERLGKRILEALYDEGTRDQGGDRQRAAATPDPAPHDEPEPSR